METISVFYDYSLIKMEHYYYFIGFEKTETLDYFKTFLKPYCDKMEITGDNRNTLKIAVNSCTMYNNGGNRTLLNNDALLRFIKECPTEIDMERLN